MANREGAHRFDLSLSRMAITAKSIFLPEFAGVPRSRQSALFANDFYYDSLSPLAVKLGVENLLPRAEV